VVPGTKQRMSDRHWSVFDSLMFGGQCMVPFCSEVMPNKFDVALEDNRFVDVQKDIMCDADNATKNAVNATSHVSDIHK